MLLRSSEGPKIQKQVDLPKDPNAETMGHMTLHRAGLGVMLVPHNGSDKPGLLCLSLVYTETQPAPMSPTAHTTSRTQGFSALHKDPPTLLGAEPHTHTLPPKAQEYL